jgi:uncharacterized protein YndB with AHSA1/START domain
LTTFLKSTTFLAREKIRGKGIMMKTSDDPIVAEQVYSTPVDAVWKVTEVVPQRKISYIWKFRGCPGESSSTFDLFDVGRATRLRVTVIVHQDFPDDIPEFERESCLGGWRYFLNERLKPYLEGKR